MIKLSYENEHKLTTSKFSCLRQDYLSRFLPRVYNVSSIIKKIATSSFIFASGGWTIFALCFCYWLIDVKKLFTRGSKMFIIVGMNSIFIYLFFHIGGASLISKIIAPFSRLLFSWGGDMTTKVITSLGVWAALWYMCYWLYKNKLFIKI